MENEKISKSKFTEEEKKKRKLEAQKKWQVNNPEKFRKMNAICQKNWAKKNVDKIRAKQKRDYELKKAKIQRAKDEQAELLKANSI